MNSASERARLGSLPAVRVTDADRREYASIVDESLRETLALYEDFAFRRKQRMDRRRWKLLRAKEGARVYRERSGSDRGLSSDQSRRSSSSGGHADSSSVSDDEPETLAGMDEPVPGSVSSADLEIGPGSSLSVRTKIPVLVTTRRVPGELEELMYGVFASDETGILRRSVYEKAGMADAVVLASLETPSEREPFKLLQVVWMLRAFAGVGAALVRPRDFLLLLSSGTVTTKATGERVGFGVAQSVVHPDLPELREQQVVRGVMSYCSIFRQLPGQEVEAFIQVVVDPRGAAMTFFIVQETVNSLLGLSSPADSALRKKLTWFIRQARERRRREAAAKTTSASLSASVGNAAVQSAAAILADGTPASSSSSSSSSTSQTCVQCAKPVGTLLGPQGHRCSICHRWACSKCRVAKSLAVRAPPDAKGAPFVARPFNFCLPCFVAAKNYPARQLQVEELRHRGADAEREFAATKVCSSNSSNSSSNPVAPGPEDAATLYRLTEE